MDIIYIPVAVIINLVSWNLAWIAPEVRDQVWMLNLHARVDNRHNHVG